MEDIPLREDSTESGGLEDETGKGGQTARPTPDTAESGALDDERTQPVDDPA